jgi:DNA-binding transcriptional ArsR family regulator
MCWLINFPAPAMLLVMKKICDCADEDGTNIFPSVATIRRETGLGESTIREAIAALEEAGILIVKAHKFGNRQGKTTTVRELDTDKLRLITGTRRKGKKPLASTHILRRGEVRIPAREGDKDEPVSVCVPGAALPSFVDARVEPRTANVLAIFVRPAGQVPDGYDAPPAVGGVGSNGAPPASGGATEAHPSSQRTPPLQPPADAPPEAGPNPSLDPSEDPSPPTPKGGRERGDDLVREVRAAKPECARAVDKLLAPLFATIRLEAPNPAFAAATLAEFAQGFDDEILGEALRLLTTPGTHYRRWSAKVADVSDAIRAGRTVVETRRSLAKPGRLIMRGTPDFDAAIAKVAEQHPEYADSLRSSDYLTRSMLKTYGVEQVTP